MALLDNARESGFYLARVSLQSPGVPVAVNVDTAESNVGSQSAAELLQRFEETDIVVAQSDADLLDAVGQSQIGRSFWFPMLVTVLGLLVIESLLAGRKPSKSASKLNSTEPIAANMENT